MTQNYPEYISRQLTGCAEEQPRPVGAFGFQANVVADGGSDRLAALGRDARREPHRADPSRLCAQNVALAAAPRLHHRLQQKLGDL
jgi:hypothetical protein